MSKFKVGDKVRYLSPEENRRCLRTYYEKNKDRVFTVTGIASSRLVTLNHYIDLDIDKLALVNTQSKEESTMKNKYEFNIRSIDQINFREIQKDLSYANPIALVETDDSNQCYVILSAEILDKDSYTNPQLLSSPIEYVFNVKKSEFAKWVEKVKAIKAKPWPDKFKSKVVVNVLSV